MHEWVALLRGVNVGGVKVLGRDLAALCTGLGWEDVRTVLATGNVRFSSPRGADELRSELEAALAGRYGRPVPVHVLPRARLAELAAAHPFAEAEHHHAYVVFCSETSVLAALLDAAVAAGVPLVPGEERIAAGDGVVFWACPRGSSLGTPFARLTARARLREALTTRNLNTVRKLF